MTIELPLLSELVAAIAIASGISATPALQATVGLSWESTPSAPVPRQILPEDDCDPCQSRTDLKLCDAGKKAAIATYSDPSACLQRTGANTLRFEWQTNFLHRYPMTPRECGGFAGFSRWKRCYQDEIERLINKNGPLGSCYQGPIPTKLQAFATLNQTGQRFSISRLRGNSVLVSGKELLLSNALRSTLETALMDDQDGNQVALFDSGCLLVSILSPRHGAWILMIDTGTGAVFGQHPDRRENSQKRLKAQQDRTAAESTRRHKELYERYRALEMQRAKASERNREAAQH